MPARVFILAAAAAAAAAAPAPVQVFTSYGADPTTSLTLSWATTAACATPVAEAGASASALTPATVIADAPFYFGNDAGAQFYYRARLTGLPAGSRLFYRVGCSATATDVAWSSVRSASLVAPRGAQPPQTILMYGDMGRDGGERELLRAASNCRKNL